MEKAMQHTRKYEWNHQLETTPNTGVLGGKGGRRPCLVLSQLFFRSSYFESRVAGP